MSTAKDARGVDIEVGATCVYGAPVGRSIALVEGVIDGFTPSGRVWVTVVRRSYGGGWSSDAKRVHVGPDRLVIVDALPPCDLPTSAEKSEERRQEEIARHRESIAVVEAGGEVPPYWGSREGALAYWRERLAKLEAE
ncbi:hypothetical protein ACFWFX_18645 [Streptomyces roseolus]|uniref:hypothetical protein n=1 Tax=Streptomyces roseolus TaxID=67358 RepID=UPI00366A2104